MNQVESSQAVAAVELQEVSFQELESREENWCLCDCSAS